MKMIVDMSSLLWQSLLTGENKEFSKKVEFDGRFVTINGWQHGFDCAVAHLVSVFKELNIGPADTIFVVEGKLSKARRKSIYSQYKEGRESRPPEAYVEFEKCREVLLETFKNLGSQTAVQDGVEGDDVIAYLTKKIDGDIVILTRDGDMTTLIDDRVALYQGGRLTRENKYGPFPCKFVPVYKALVGDGNEYKGAFKFGEKAFLDFLVWAGDPGLAALEGMMIRRTLHELEEDVAEFKPLKKVIDSAEHVYQSYQCALLHDEWVNNPRQPLIIENGNVVTSDKIKDSRLIQWATGVGEVKADWWELANPKKKPIENKMHAVYDCELIGKENPVFLMCARIVETGQKYSFWWHHEGEMDAMHRFFQREDITFVSFNGIHFDQPIISAAIGGKHPTVLKKIADELINGEGKAWQIYSMFNFDKVEFDHIDLIEVSPGVRVSLKTFAGRMGYPTMVDLPYHHDQDLAGEQLDILELYCENDLGVTEALFNKLRDEINLRMELSLEHDIDLRSKSDAQVAEAILKKAANIKSGGEKPTSVTYRAPDFIETDSDVINEVIQTLHNTRFSINAGNGQVETPEFLQEPVQLGYGTYQMGIGGLHSTHDKAVCVEATEGTLISDFDVSSYYPFTMVNAGITPRINNGAAFVAAYKKILYGRIAAKRRMQEVEAEMAEIEKELSDGE